MGPSNRAHAYAGRRPLTHNAEPRGGPEEEQPMDALVYPCERTLGTITLLPGLVVRVLVVAGTLGIVLAYLLLGFIACLFAQSAFIAHIKNTAVRLTPQRLPDQHARFVACCQKLQIGTPPEAYVLAGNGVLNAFATRFLGRHFVVLLSDTVDAMEAEPDGVNFYIGAACTRVARQGRRAGAPARRHAVDARQRFDDLDCRAGARRLADDASGCARPAALVLPRRRRPGEQGLAPIMPRRHRPP
jgi:hypothetical protein